MNFMSTWNSNNDHQHISRFYFFLYAVFQNIIIKLTLRVSNLASKINAIE